MKKVRFGVVGVGGMGGSHARGIVRDGSKDFCLSAVADIVPAIARRVGEQLGVPHFTSGQAMFDSGLCDAAIIATPHYWHPPLTIRAARAGLHVLCEKPIAVTVGAARAMIAECRRRKVALGAMLQQRTRAIMRKMKQLVDSGRLGEVFRVSMICSNWYRTQFYYSRGSWRGTWDGEGGGVLINQAPHSLDLFQWIGGMPKRILASVDTRLHNIEVENTANVICLYGKGKNGYIYATTAEAPGAEQLMVCGDKATLIAEGGKLRLGRLKTPISRHLKTARIAMKSPECTWSEVKVPAKGGGGHIGVIRAFAAHVLRGTPMVAGGEEAINELEISNAIYLSGYESRIVDLPVDARRMERLVGKLVRERSSGRGGDLRAKAARDLRRLGVITGR